jgi:hypothetical protein
VVVLVDSVNDGLRVISLKSDRNKGRLRTGMCVVSNGDLLLRLTGERRIDVELARFILDDDDDGEESGEELDD